MMPKEQPELMTMKEVAALLRVSSSTVKRWGRKGHGPKAIRINSRGDRRYRREEVMKFLEAYEHY